MTDREIMIHRFKNPRKSTSVLAGELGMPTSIYESACARALEKDSWPRAKTPAVVRVKVRRREGAHNK